MADKIEFLAKLGELVQVAMKQDHEMTMEEIEQFFGEGELSKEQLQMVCDYLEEQLKKEPVQLTEEENEYLKEYEKDIELMAADPSTKQLASFLPKVVEAAKELHHPEIFIGDMIQEGTIGLMMALASGDVNESEAMAQVRASMRAMIEEQNEAKRRDNQMVEKVAELDTVLEEMSKELGRKVTLDELAERLGISEEEVEDILKLAGEDAGEEAEEEDEE